MIAAPHTYAEWVRVLDLFQSKSNDENVLQAMRQGTIEWQTGVAERFARRLIDAVNVRINAATDKFQRDLSHAHGQEGAIIQALLALRKELSFLAKAINLPALPAKDRNHYLDLVVRKADEIQKALEDSARQDHTGRLASIVRNHKVNRL